MFVFNEPTSVGAWESIDDRVMGGISRSGLRYDSSGVAVFEGLVSPVNNGGFASVRAGLLRRVPPEMTALLLNVCGDGKRYKLNLRTEDTFDGVNYQAAFETTAGQWATVRLPISAFVPTFRGKPVMGAPKLKAEQIRQVGLMIADRQYGIFALMIKSISAAL